MRSPLSENSPPMPCDRQMVIQELINGQKLTSDLQILLGKSSEQGVSPAAKALAEKIFQSIAGAISKLNSGETHEGCWNSAKTHHCSAPSGDRKIKGSGEKHKIPAAKDQRSGHKRRRTSTTAWRLLSANPYDDGHIWRKYGQKEILGATYPRGYFRCTHKHDQGCQATKHVQKSENDPSLYVVTYMEQHTCKDVLKTPQLILDSTSGELCVLNYESTMPRKHDRVLTSSFTSLKHETIAEKPIDLNQASSSPSSYHISFDHETFDSHLQMEFSMGDVASSVYSSTSSHNLDMDMKDPFKLDDVLAFSELEFIA
nr:WRKY56 [Phoebe bournei]